MKEIIAKNFCAETKNTYTLIDNGLPADGVTVKVTISHDDDNLIAEFDIIEKQLRRMATHHNDEVYEDSCVEIFIMKDGDEFYRNFELSASMWALVGEGAPINRHRLDPKRIDKIERNIKILENNNKKSHYLITEKINLRDWGFLAKNEKIEDLKLKGNIYKCGDKLEDPHKLTLFEMKEGYTTFHDPSCFQRIKFE
jgi:hypothetical protein